MCIDPDLEENLHMYRSADLAVTPLYENAPTTVLEAIKHQLSWFSNHPSISKEALSDMLYTLHYQILPSDNTLPDSYSEAMKLIKDYLIKPNSCPNDCIAFRGEYADSVVCPKCGAERYIRNKIPSKSFTYFPIGPRIVRMFESPVYSKLIQAHASTSLLNLPRHLRYQFSNLLLVGIIPGP